jgi:hypothetical protein
MEKIIRESYNRETVTEGEDDPDSTIQIDVRSISAIYHLRKGIRATTIKKSQHLFVSTNGALARAARQYEISESKGSHEDWVYSPIPACATDVFIGTAVWLQSPQDVKIAYKSKLLADCYAALRPTREMLKLFINEAKTLREKEMITDDQYAFLRNHPYTEQWLQDLIHGDPHEITDKTPEQVLDAITAEATKPFREEKKKMECQLEEERERHYQNEVLRAQESKKKDEAVKALEGKVKYDAKRYAKVCSWIVAFALSFIVACSLFQGQALIPLNIPNFIKIVISIIGGLVIFLLTYYGSSIRKIKTRLEHIIYTRRIKRYGIEDDIIT